MESAAKLECMKEQVLETKVWLPRLPQEVFPFFADAANLDAITPPWLHFKIRCELPIQMKVGASIAYSIRIHGIPIRWRTNIARWEPPFCFVDEQVRGPYQLWHHTHTFAAQDGGTLCTDRVRYKHLGGSLIERFLVRPDVEKIFAFRQMKLVTIFADAALPTGLVAG